MKPEPDRAFPQTQSAHVTFWDFISLTPQSMHMIIWVMSDRAIPRSFRFMVGFGVHTLLDGRTAPPWLRSVANEAVKINGADPDFHGRDLWDAIQSGAFPERGCGHRPARSHQYERAGKQQAPISFRAGGTG